MMPSRESHTRPQIQRYIVQSSDVISDLRINILEEGSDRVIWYKERYLSDEEIIENICDNARNGLVLWTVHRPKRGWYIRIRAPSFPPKSFIALGAVPRASAHYVDGALMFGCRTNVPSETTNGADIPTAHSYPPTPPSVSDSVPPSPATVAARLSQIGASGSGPRSSNKVASRAVGGASAASPAQRVTQFLLSPLAAAPPATEAEKPSLFARALAVVQSVTPHHSTSFTLAPLPPPSTLGSSSMESTSTAALTATPNSADAPTTAPHNHRHRMSQLLHVHSGTPAPLLTYHDRTSSFNFHSTNGLIELDAVQARALGIQPSFWVTVALTYLEFVSDREGYLAASADVA